MREFIMGLVLGLVILLPGMSGGTVLLIFGLYEDLVNDLSKFRFMKYRKVALGLILGIFMGSQLFTFLFERYEAITLAVLLGCLLASVKTIIKTHECYNIKLIIIMILGAVMGLLVTMQPNQVQTFTEVPHVTLFIAGALASAAMILPGVPGSSVLILFGIYEEIIYYVANLHWMPLFVFAMGSIIGTVFLIKLLAKAFEKFKCEMSYFFSGIIIGSSKMLIPKPISIEAIVFFVLAFLSTWIMAIVLEKK